MSSAAGASERRFESDVVRSGAVGDVGQRVEMRRDVIGAASSCHAGSARACPGPFVGGAQTQRLVHRGAERRVVTGREGAGERLVRLVIDDLGELDQHRCIGAG